MCIYIALRNVELHDYLVELDMKRGGSKAVRATRLREGLLHLKSETLAGIYNGKSFDDMSKLELRWYPISQSPHHNKICICVPFNHVICSSVFNCTDPHVSVIQRST